ncbi:MAG: M20/M25/M40 family metallo-hydrolase, partial [Fidelibacterota bacterium]
IMLGFAEQVNQVRDQLKNRIVLLFQPAEETAQGAKAVLQDQRFSGIEPDFIFGLHNLPGFERHSVILRENIFASASVGMIFRFTGATSHAAHPENGKNPALAIAQMIQSLYAIPQQFTAFNNANLITIIQVKVGEQAFGTSAGDGMVAATFRSHTNKDLQIMKDRAFKTATNLAATFDLEIEVEEMEEFSATKNHEQAFSIVEKAANKTGLTIVKVPNPFPWSEDFGFFTEKYKGCFFGLGSGKNHPQLHNHNYDFPDELIPTGIKLFSTLLDISE